MNSLPSHPARRAADTLCVAETPANPLADALLACCQPMHGGRLLSGMVDVLALLWSEQLGFDAADPSWPDRDRFVMSPGYGAAMLYALLHLTGHAGMGSAQLAAQRTLGSATPGHPDHTAHHAVEATTGPLGQGLGMAVGMALAERLMAARFGKSLVNHRTWVVATLGDLMEGISHEAASLAGYLRLEKLAVLLEDDTAAAACNSGLAGPDDAARRFAALGWAVRAVDAQDTASIASALALTARARKPTLIVCRTATRPARAALAGAAALWRQAGSRGAAPRRSWLKRLANHPRRAEFERVLAGRLPDGWSDALATFKTTILADRTPASTRDSAERLLETLAAGFPELVGGQTELGIGRGPPVMPGSFSGRQVHYGLREHGMAACLNGLALHGGLLPYAVAPLVMTDAMRPALRLCALMRLRAIHVATHDSIGLGADGAAYQPAEQLATLRAMPGLLVMRPADALETAECCELAVRRTDGPSLLVLSEQAVPALRTEAVENRCARGAYLMAEADGPRAATLIATGSEVAPALAARALLAAEGVRVAVVSMPCWGLFARADSAYRAVILGSAPRIGVEAGCGFGWERWLGEDGLFLGLPGFGASAPAADLYDHFGLTPEAIAAAVRRRIGTVA